MVCKVNTEYWYVNLNHHGQPSGERCEPKSGDDFVNTFVLMGKTRTFVIYTSDLRVTRQHALAFAVAVVEGKLRVIQIDLSQL